MYNDDSQPYRKKEKGLWIGVTAGSANDSYELCLGRKYGMWNE